MKIEVKMFPPIIGMSSLVAIHETIFPFKFGNYCSIDTGPYLVNMWAENLEEISRLNPDQSIEVTIFSEDSLSLGLVTDERLKDWCNPEPCITGRGWVSREICEEICKRMNFSTYNFICGCESPTTKPYVNGSRRRVDGTRRENGKEDGIWFNVCQNCERLWEHQKDK